MHNAIIALTSRRGRSGKDTLVECLRGAGHDVFRVAFGDVLKRQCAEVLTFPGHNPAELEAMFHDNRKDCPVDFLSLRNIPPSEYSEWVSETQWEWDWAEMAAPRTPRWHLQQYGTGFRRNYLNDPDVWLREGLAHMEEARPNQLVVVTDLRQLNEYDALRKLRASIVRLNRDWVIPEVDSAPFHSTDIELDNVAFKAIVNNRWGYAFDMVHQLIKQGVIT